MLLGRSTGERVTDSEGALLRNAHRLGLFSVTFSQIRDFRCRQIRGRRQQLLLMPWPANFPPITSAELEAPCQPEVLEDLYLELYEKLTETSADADCEVTINAFSWLFCAQRALTSREFLAAYNNREFP